MVSKSRFTVDFFNWTTIDVTHNGLNSSINESDKVEWSEVFEMPRLPEINQINTVRMRFAIVVGPTTLYKVAVHFVDQEDVANDDISIRDFEFDFVEGRQCYSCHYYKTFVHDQAANNDLPFGTNCFSKTIASDLIETNPPR